MCAPDLIVQREIHLVHLEAKITPESDDESGDVDHESARAPLSCSKMTTSTSDSSDASGDGDAKETALRLPDGKRRQRCNGDGKCFGPVGTASLAA